MPSTTESTIVSIAASTTKETSVCELCTSSNRFTKSALFIELFVKQRFRDKVLIKPKNLELAYHMEQIQMATENAGGASFIQILGTFFLKNYFYRLFSYIKNSLFN